jgi:hypothetical protein
MTEIPLWYEDLEVFPKPLTAPGSRKNWPTEGTRREVPYSKTEQLLFRELEFLRVRTAVIQVAVGPDGFRLNGGFRANARARHPGVVLNLTTPYGPLTFATDLYQHWQANVRAVALALEGLRRLDRYGITRSGQQYQGWSALPPGTGEAPVDEIRVMTAEMAAKIICETAGAPDLTSLWTTLPPEVRASLYRTAIKKAHPDTGGDPDLAAEVTEAAAVLDV